jgi:hypothetical protein
VQIEREWDDNECVVVRGFRDGEGPARALAERRPGYYFADSEV